MDKKVGSKSSKKLSQQPRRDISGTLAAKEPHDIVDIADTCTPPGVDTEPFDLASAASSSPARRLFGQILTPPTPEQIEEAKRMRARIDRALAPVQVKAVVVSRPASASTPPAAPASTPSTASTPPAAPTVIEAVETKTWIINEAKQLKARDEILAGIGITDFARMLVDRMREAAKSNSSIRLIPSVGYIKNHLREWGLYPIAGIPSIS